MLEIKKESWRQAGIQATIASESNGSPYDIFFCTVGDMVLTPASPPF